MVWADIALAAATVISAGLGYAESQQQGKYANRALSIADDQRMKQDTSFNQLQDLLTNPGSFFSSPVYNAALDQGTKAVSRGNAAAGYLGSGNMSVALQTFGQSFGQQQLFQQESLLAGMSGVGFNPAGAVQTASNAGSAQFNQLGQILASLGYSSKGSGGSTDAFTPMNADEPGFGGSTSGWANNPYSGTGPVPGLLEGP